MNELTDEQVAQMWAEALNGGAPIEEDAELELAIDLDGSAPTRIREGIE